MEGGTGKNGLRGRLCGLGITDDGIVGIRQGASGESKMSRHVQIALKFWPAILGGLLILGLAQLEQRFLPVVNSFTVTSIWYSQDGIIVKGTMVKTRHCEFIGVSAHAESGSGDMVTLPIRFLDDDSPGTFSRPTGSQEWGPWKFYTPLAPRIKSITLTSAHSCHTFWITRTHLVTIDLKE